MRKHVQIRWKPARPEASAGRGRKVVLGEFAMAIWTLADDADTLFCSLWKTTHKWSHLFFEDQEQRNTCSLKPTLSPAVSYRSLASRLYPFSSLCPPQLLPSGPNVCIQRCVLESRLEGDSLHFSFCGRSHALLLVVVFRLVKNMSRCDTKVRNVEAQGWSTCNFAAACSASNCIFFNSRSCLALAFCLMDRISLSSISFLSDSISACIRSNDVRCFCSFWARCLVSASKCLGNSSRIK